MKKLALAEVIYTFVAINRVANLLCASGRLMNTANWLHRSPTGRSTWVVWGGVSGEVSPSHYGVQCRFAWA